MTPRAKYKLFSLGWLFIGFGIVPFAASFIPSPWNWLMLILTAISIALALRAIRIAERTYGWPMPKDWEAEQTRRINEYIRRSQQ